MKECVIYRCKHCNEEKHDLVCLECVDELIKRAVATYAKPFWKKLLIVSWWMFFTLLSCYLAAYAILGDGGHGD